jgi:hypothetical protein
LFCRFEKSADGSDAARWVSFTKKSKLRVQRRKTTTPASYRMVVRDEAGKVLVNMMISKDMRFDLSFQKDWKNGIRGA